MTHAELEAVVDRCSTEERLFLAACLQRRSKRGRLSMPDELSRAHREIQGGRKIGLRQLKRLHRALVGAGL